MAAPKMDELVAMEAQYGLTDDGLTYQQRCSRIVKYQNGESWEPPQPAEVKRGTLEPAPMTIENLTEPLKLHPLYGKKLIITPLMAPDKDRNVYFDEPVGHEVEVEEVEAGALLWGEPKDIDRMVGDYKIVKENPNRIVTAKTTLPKIGQEISWTVGKDLVPVVRGNDGNRGYIWAMAPHMRQFGNTMIQFQGLKSLLTTICPELLPKFSGKPIMTYIDGLVLTASIPMTEAILKEHRRKELQDAKLGLV